MEAYFASYEVMSRMCIPEGENEQPSSLWILMCGGLAGVVGWLSTYPVDVIKTRLQSCKFI
jgi:solute carrier family 25 (mitochondrial carnitine/acylcarnitine transporter), member 20/29